MKTVNPEIIDINSPPPGQRRLAWTERPRRAIQLTYGVLLALSPAIALDAGCAWLLDQAQNQGAWIAWPILLVLLLPALVATLIGALVSLVFVAAIAATIFGRDVVVSSRTMFRASRPRPVKTVR